MSDSHLSFGRIGNLLSSPITRVRRINYVNPNGDRDERRGPIEFTFGGGVILRLESSSDGVSLRLRVGEWIDPFGGRLSEENAAFVRASGKWTAHDVSREPGYRKMIGHLIGAVTLLTMNDLVTGVELTMGGVVLRAEVDADELVVDVSGD